MEDQSSVEYFLLEKPDRRALLRLNYRFQWLNRSHMALIDVHTQRWITLTEAAEGLRPINEIEALAWSAVMSEGVDA